MVVNLWSLDISEAMSWTCSTFVYQLQRHHDSLLLFRAEVRGSGLFIGGTRFSPELLAAFINVVVSTRWLVHRRGRPLLCPRWPSA